MSDVNIYKISTVIRAPNYVSGTLEKFKDICEVMEQLERTMA